MTARSTDDVRGTAVHRARLGAVLLALACLASAGYGAWCALFYDGVSPVLVPFALAAIAGAVIAVLGAARRSPRLLGAGALLQVLSPTGFAWILCLALAVVGLTVLVLGWRSSRRVGRPA